MYDVPVPELGRLEPWRERARIALAAEIYPDQLAWREAGQPRELHASLELPSAPAGQVRVPAAFVDLARTAVCHRSPERYPLLYRLLWRLAHGERGLLEMAIDGDVRRVQAIAKAVRRDLHKMRAFVRFRRVQGVEPEQFVAWFEPAHHIVEANAGFFERRFAAMRWSILTPERSAHWDGLELRLGPGATPAQAPSGDALEELWRTYYGHIFNPARLKVHAMRAEMPKKYWKNLPEAGAIQSLVREARQRTGEMIGNEPTPPLAKASRWVPAPPAEPPAGGDLPTLNRALAACERCDLHRFATQAVAGEGPLDASLMLVGEQPGDEEDLSGRPFVGPAGRLLDELLRASGIERERAYLTNAVKHFRFHPRGKRRMHQRPDGGHLEHCRWWLDSELALIRPGVIVALGASAAHALLRHPVQVGEVRGRPLPFGPAILIVTWHPSYLLRLREAGAVQAARALMVQDLELARQLAKEGRAEAVAAASREGAATEPAAERPVEGVGSASRGR